MSEKFVDRVLPHNLEAERSVLGAILIENELLFVAMKFMKADDCFRDAHRRIFKAFVWLSEQGMPIDLVTVKDRLIAQGDLEEVGGPSYLAALIDGVPRSTNVEYYADIVREKAALREIIRIGSKAIAMAYEQDQPLELVLQHVEELLFDLRGERVPGKLVPASEGARDLIRDLEWLEQHPGELTGITSGSAKIDNETHGFQRGDMIILAGRPSMGKTALVVEIAKSMAAAGKGRVALFSLEMRRKQIDRRLLSNVSGVELTRILKGQLGALDWPRLREAMAAIDDLPLWIDDTPTRTVWDIRSACRLMRSEKEGLAGVIIDYVQLMGTADNRRRRGDNRTQELSDISRRLKILAGELDVPVIVLSQLVRLEGNEKPQIHHLRESGSLEQDADVIMLMWGKSHQASGIREINIAKQRNGPTGTVLLNFEREIVRFTDAPDAPPEDETPAPPQKRKPVKAPRSDRW